MTVSFIPVTITMAQETPLSPWRGSRLAGVAWLPRLFGSELGGACAQEREHHAERCLRSLPWAGCHRHVLRSLWTALPSTRPATTSHLQMPVPSHHSPLSLLLQERYVGVAHPSYHETRTDREKRTKVGLWEPGAPQNLQFIPATCA